MPAPARGQISRLRSESDVPVRGPLLAMDHSTVLYCTEMHHSHQVWRTQPHLGTCIIRTRAKTRTRTRHGSGLLSLTTSISLLKTLIAALEPKHSFLYHCKLWPPPSKGHWHHPLDYMCSSLQSPCFLPNFSPLRVSMRKHAVR